MCDVVNKSFPHYQLVCPHINRGMDGLWINRTPVLTYFYLPCYSCGKLPEDV
jgi:hypothetical protein